MSANLWAEGTGSLAVAVEPNPVSLHALAHEPAMLGLRIECPITGQVVTVALNPLQLEELRSGLNTHLASLPAPDPYAGAEQRLDAWKAQNWRARRAGLMCDDCDDNDQPCACQVAERPHLKCGLTYTEQLAEAMGGRR